MYAEVKSPEWFSRNLLKFLLHDGKMCYDSAFEEAQAITDGYKVCNHLHKLELSDRLSRDMELAGVFQVEMDDEIRDVIECVKFVEYIT